MCTVRSFLDLNGFAKPFPKLPAPRTGANATICA